MQTPPELPNMSNRFFEISLEVLIAILIGAVGFVWRAIVWGVQLVIVPLKNGFLDQMASATESREKAVAGLKEVKEEIAKTNEKLDQLIKKEGHDTK